MALGGKKRDSVVSAVQTISATRSPKVLPLPLTSIWEIHSLDTSLSEVVQNQNK
jgi:predicted ATPase